MRFLLVPLLLLASIPCYLAAVGLGECWWVHTNRAPTWPVVYALSAALHAAWIWCAARHRAGSVVLLNWMLAFAFCRRGLLALGFSSAFLFAVAAVSVPLSLALVLTPSSWPERLARWRRGRSEMAIQLRMAQGLIPWASASIRQLLTGTADRPAGVDSGR